MSLYTNLSIQFLATILILFFFFLHQATPLHVAAKEGRNNTVEFLVKQRAYTKKKNSAGVSIYILVAICRLVSNLNT